MPRSRRALLLTLSLALVAVAPACSGSSPDAASTPADAEATTTTTTLAAFDGSDFYAAPDPIPTDPHGTLVRFQEADFDVPDATAYQIMYTSESIAGDPIVVTGIASVPTA
ncbi:MAG: hypothetical protein KDA94_13275, partial [Acidimicrobiales bacterium]|nr:hypothetical protein [Acidimicrobiales bacterium]